MIIYACSDLMFSTKVRSTADALGIPARPARNAEAMDKRLDRIEDGKCNDPVTGVLVDLDLAEAGLELIAQVKARDATIPVVAFGSHVATEVLQGARERGADFVMARSAFVANLPDLLKRFGGGAV